MESCKGLNIIRKKWKSHRKPAENRQNDLTETRRYHFWVTEKFRKICGKQKMNFKSCRKNRNSRCRCHKIGQKAAENLKTHIFAAETWKETLYYPTSIRNNQIISIPVEYKQSFPQCITYFIYGCIFYIFLFQMVPSDILACAGSVPIEYYQRNICHWLRILAMG